MEVNAQRRLALQIERRVDARLDAVCNGSIFRLHAGVCGGEFVFVDERAA